MRGTERVHSPAPHPPKPTSGEHENKGGEPSSAPALFSPSELVEHSSAHGVDHPVRQLSRQGVVIPFVEREVA